MSAIDNYSCPACGTYFDTITRKNQHIRQSPNCAWYREDIAAQWTARQDPLDDFIEDVSQLQLDDRDLFQLVPPTDYEPPAEHVAIGQPGPGPRTQAHRQAQLRILDDYEDTRVIDEHISAGARIRMDPKVHDVWRRRFQGTGDMGGRGGEGRAGDSAPSNAPDDLYSPFASELEWRIAHWAVTENIAQNSLNRLLAIPQVLDRLGVSFRDYHALSNKLEDIPKRAGSWFIRGLSFRDQPDDVYILRGRDPVEAVRSLWGDPSLAKHLVYRPRKVFANATRVNRLYSEMWTGEWWHTVQERLPAGATVAPLIVATDKTQLTNFSGGKTAYPVYLTIGNLPKAIRRKPSMHACVLIGYLPTEKVLDEQLTTQEARSRAQRVFHESMRVLLEPLIQAGTDGVEMTGGNGEVRRVFPILAAYVADYPEQCLVACSKSGTCPKCQCPADCLQDDATFDARTEKWTKNIMEEAKDHGRRTSASYFKYCMERDVAGGVYLPFWEDLPHSNIHVAITPDVLHQLYQGVFKHLLSWCKQLLGAEELDRRLRTLPHAFGLRHFDNGISALSQITGSERKQMARVLLGCLVGAIPNHGLKACRGLLDFMYYAQYSSHDRASLDEMQAALDLWQANKSFFVQMGVREDLNIPKLHSLHHYIESIRRLGTTDNYNTELFERLHIDFAKRGWRASNKRDAFPQMIRWLDRQEKVIAFDRYITEINPPLPKRMPSNPAGTRISVAKHPDSKGRKVTTVESTHHAAGFARRLREYLNTFVPKPLTARVAALAPLPFDRVDIFHQFKVCPVGVDDDGDGEETVKAAPGTPQSPGRSDMVLVLDRDTAQAAGFAGTRVGRVKVVFKLPRVLDIYGPHPAPEAWPKGPLAYVEWFSPLRRAPDGVHGMFKVARMGPSSREGVVPGAIIPLANIRQSCMLIPVYGHRLDISSQKAWTSDNVLDKCEDFLVNNWQSMYTYKTMW